MFVQALRDKLLAEAEASATHNAQVAQRWQDLFALEVPQELHAEMVQQQEACSTIISSKDSLISG